MLVADDVEPNVDRASRYDKANEADPQPIPLGQHFAASTPGFQEAVRTKHMSDTKGGEK